MQCGLDQNQSVTVPFSVTSLPTSKAALPWCAINGTETTRLMATAKALLGLLLIVTPSSLNLCCPYCVLFIYGVLHRWRRCQIFCYISPVPKASNTSPAHPYGGLATSWGICPWRPRVWYTSSDRQSSPTTPSGRGSRGATVPPRAPHR